jgi:ABC-type multidrug transport system ATPase subunit
MRRVSLGVELVVRPSILLLDEVTSGLDSDNALQMLEVLKVVADRGASVLLSIHQPSSQMMESIFDHVILMHQGRCMYQGSVQDIESYFGARGCPLPPAYNPAEWILSVSQRAASTEELERRGLFKDFPISMEIHTDKMIPSALKTRTNRLSIFQKLEETERVPILTEVWTLVKREVGLKLKAQLTDIG